MACPVPFSKFNKKQGRVDLVPCGRCLQCRIDNRNSWTWRLQAEMQDKDAVFLTLTIDEDHLCGPSLYLSSLQKFWKRLRKCLNKDFKYFAVGEYGELDGRPHYHAIVIGLSCGKYLSSDDGDIPYIRKCWPFGFIKCVPAGRGSIRYVLKYLDKMQDDSTFEALHPSCIPPFHCSSKGIGRTWLLRNVSKLRESNGLFFFDGAWRPLPRYYLEKIFSPEELENRPRRVNSSKARAIRDYVRAHGCSVSVARYELGKQALVDLRSRMNVSGKSIKK